MSTYIKLSTLEYPRHEGDIRLEHPEILESQTGDAFPCPSTYAPVQWEAPPNDLVDGYIAEEVAPVCVDGVWKMQWRVRQVTAAELEEAERFNAIPPVFKQDLSMSGEEPNVIG